MVEHQVQWTAPSPLWAETATSPEPLVRQSFSQPAILRFTTDTFMDDFLAMLEKDPSQLTRLVAEPETWRGPLQPSTAAASSEPSVRMPKLVRKFERLRLAASRTGNGSSSPDSLTKSILQSKKNGSMLKLYQPAHQRYYLITTCLVCGITGMPDRKINPGREERASFVLRRLFPPGKLDPTEILPEFDAVTWEEHAFVVTPDGAGWKKIGTKSDAASASLVAGEEKQPLFALNYLEEDDRTRRVLAGLVPVGKREAYMGAATLSSDEKSKSIQNPLPKTTRKILFRSQVAEPWKNVIDQAERFKKILVEPSDPLPFPYETDSLLKVAREQIQTQSWLILLDLAEYLNQYVKEVWDAMADPDKESTLTTTAQRDLLAALKNTKSMSAVKNALISGWEVLGRGTVPSPYSTSDIKATLYEALRAIVAEKEKLEKATGSYDREKKENKWPGFLFPLADPVVAALSFSNSVPPLEEQDEVDGEEELHEEGSGAPQTAKDGVDALVALVVRAMKTESSEPVPPLPVAARPVMDMREGVFVIRAIFQRPNCGPLKPTVVSEPTRPFQMAGFFDPDAPARPIRIALPIDTTPAGLRKFDKNTAFMISDVLCGQIQRLKGMTLGDLVRSVLPWPFHKDLSVPDTGPCTAESNPNLQLGMICSLSIPIVTICALILLMIVVSVLDYIFRWIPYLIMCFPLPGFKAKK